ncbi:MAG TPA: JAB domain-containing protein [Hanamia sp.]|nr:JAB domain-containing protein [Hanamia sp.]
MKSKKQNSKEEIFQQLKGSWTIAEIEITYKPIITDHTIISSSSQAYELIKTLWEKEKINLQEQIAALFFNQSKNIIGWKVLSTGNMTKCIVDLKLLVSLALHCMCTHVMIVHNHPSGNLKVSQPDESITLTIKDALKLIDVQLIDHLIIVENGYLSFNDEGLF